MRKIFVIALLIIVLLGIFFYAFHNRIAAVLTPESKVTASMRDFLAPKTDAKKCTTLPNQQVNGTMYVGLTRVHFDMPASGAQLEKHITLTDGVAYVWSNTATGQRMLVDSLDLIDTKFDFDCQAWTEDAAIFAPSQDVHFTSEEIQPAVADPAAPQTVNRCDTCTNPDATLEASCKASFHCN